MRATAARTATPTATRPRVGLAPTVASELEKVAPLLYRIGERDVSTAFGHPAFSEQITTLPLDQQKLVMGDNLALLVGVN